MSSLLYLRGNRKARAAAAALAALAALAAVAPSAAAERADAAIVLPDEDDYGRLKDATFAVPPEMASRVRFWRDVYAKYSTGQIVIHDQENFDVVYAVIDETDLLAGATSRSERGALIEKEKQRINRILLKLADEAVGPSELTEEDLKIYAAVRKFQGWRKFVGRLRAQEGLADEFRRGVEASGAYWAEIEAIFQSYGLPKELARLCFVESLFRFDAYSKVGATGLWQFMRSTGKLYMTVNDAVDERLDPIASTHAAAKLLRDNYRILGAWPLAVTAYNHGRGGISRAVSQTGSSDIVRIINEYQSPSFKFASKNFYASFLAAKEILDDPDRYFPDLNYAPPARLASFELPRAARLRDLAQAAGMSREDLAAYNPAWLRPITTDRLPVPAGALVRVPEGRLADVRAAFGEGAISVQYARAALPSLEGALEAPARPVSVLSGGEPFAQHVVASGDTLGSIARRYGATVGAIREANGLGPTDLLRTGQTLRLPGGGTTTAAVAEPAVPASVRLEPAPAVRVPRSEPSRASVERRRAAKEPDQYILHRVMKGETIYKIAKSYRVTSKEIREANGLSGDAIRVGQFLKIPRS